jgi:hypothetical protein
MGPAIQGCDNSHSATPSGKSGSGGQRDAGGGTGGGGTGGQGASGGAPGGTAGSDGCDGCSQDAGDSGPDDANDAGDADTTVFVRSRQAFITESAMVERDFDLSTLDAAAFVLDGDAGSSTFRIYTPKYPDPTRMEIAGIPTGVYYLRTNRPGDVPTFFVTSARFVDLGSVIHGRVDSKHAAAGTALVMNASGLSEWKATDDISLYVYNSGAQLISAHALASAGNPVPGGTALNGLTVDYAAHAGPAPLVDGMSGDRVKAIQLVTRTLAGSEHYTAAGKVFDLPAFAMSDGQSTTVSGAFVEVPQSSSISVDWKLPEFLALASANPSANRGMSGLSVSVTRAPEHGPFDFQPKLLEYSTQSTTGIVASFDYGNPYDTTFTPIVTAVQNFTRDYALSGATPVSIVARILSMNTASTAVPLRPLVGPPENLQINGQDARVDRSGVGRNPTLSWSPPSVGTAHSYTVRFIQLVNSGGQTQQMPSGSLQTTLTSVVTPPGLLIAGNRYAIVVRSSHVPGFNQDSQPLRVSYPYGFAEILSGIITP